MAAADFESLCSERERLRIYVLRHASSLKAFKEEERPWFRRQEKSTGSDSGKQDRALRHLTTSASCLQSLSDVPTYETGDAPPPAPPDAADFREWRRKVTQEFCREVLSAKKKEWQSEGQKLVYTKVRTLPIILNLVSDEVLKGKGRQLKTRLGEVWDTLDVADVMAQGIGEGPMKDGEGYPPNAFHTYWAIRLLVEYRDRQSVLPPLAKGLDEKEAVARLWARRTLATQTALITSQKEKVDAQQLAWALSTDVLCRDGDQDEPSTSDHQHEELYEAALSAFFGEQKEGHWRLYEPLFHYQQAGNAYCYPYETLAELLRLALQKKKGRVLRSRLRHYSQELIDAWHYARDTAVELETGGGLGWCSGHHPHRTAPEAWATASVFSYLQHLRCLLGYWAAEAAKRDLQVQTADGGANDKGRKALRERGETWVRDEGPTVGQQLAMLFLNPIEATKTEGAAIDPDTPLVDESRSAVLFGPPGTSKTSVVRGLADALGWDFVEVLASSFLSEGMDSVPKSADAIFQKLMELDHCVILFDEIDELIRVRDDEGSDPFGRFLTTSMLPKLAKLWEQRRVLFFVATNDIEAADPAIKRSQRFDAAMFVPPPSFEKKRVQLQKVLGAVPPELTKEGVEAAVRGDGDAREYLGVFAFLRWDQIDDLANRIKLAERRPDSPGGQSPLEQALIELGEELHRTDWQRSKADKEKMATKDGKKDEGPFRPMFERWRSQKINERRDYRKKAVLGLEEGLFDQIPEGWEPYRECRGYVVFNADVVTALQIGENEMFELEGSDWQARDDHGIFFFVQA